MRIAPLKNDAYGEFRRLRAIAVAAAIPNNASSDAIPPKAAGAPPCVPRQTSRNMLANINVSPETM
jgi:hypothetical protein